MKEDKPIAGVNTSVSWLLWSLD